VNERTVSKEQKHVVVGMATGLIASAAVFYLGHEKLPPFVPVIMEPVERVTYALRWLTLPTLTLAAGVARVATRRFFSEEAIGGDDGDHALEIDRRYVQNTAEQLLLAIPVHLIFAYHVRATSFRLIVVASLWFLVARIAFWVGYHRAPSARSFGFAATFYPTLGLLGYSIYRMVTGS
jgi:hypothetical protein